MTEDSNELETKRVCYACGSDKTYVATSYGYRNPQWFSNLPIGWLCKRCNTRYITNVRWHPITNRRRVKFTPLAKQLYCQEEIKIGVCNWCRAVVPFDCKITAIHHEQYDSTDILKHTIEICAACHRRFHSR